MEIEIWKDIKGYEGLYQVSNFGNVKRLKGSIVVRDNYHKRIYIKTINEKIISKQIDSSGYYTTNIQNKRVRVHLLVASVFLKRSEKDQCINHINGIKTDNRADNLEWCTYKENTNHAIKTGLMKIPKRDTQRIRMKALDDITLKEFNSIAEAYKYLNKKRTGNICESCKGSRVSAYGYKWEYI